LLSLGDFVMISSFVEVTPTAGAKQGTSAVRH